MHKLLKPLDDPGLVFLMCISCIRDSDLKLRLMAVAPNIAVAAQAYETAATALKLYKLTPSTGLGGGVTDSDMIGVYGRMVKKDSPGRALYDRLLSAPANGICPLCGQRVVSTLDHYLPKTIFPALAVVPSNLIPCCQDCNKAKSNHIANSVEEQLLHPYFDDVGGDLWLHARVHETTPPAVSFHVNPPSCWDTTTAKRVVHHFKMLGLGKLYASHAGAELSSIQHRLEILFDYTGAIGVEDHLKSEAQSRSVRNRNSWQSAMYTALAGSQWFCSGGFR